MTKGNVIDFSHYLTTPMTSPNAHATMSEELQLAIQHLIHQLRESGPLA